MFKVKVSDELNNGRELDVEEGKSYVAVKKCRMLRSGVQFYTRDEVPAELLKQLPEEKQKQQVFRVYRRPEAVVKHLKDFNYISFVNGHPSYDVTPENHKSLEIGKVGGKAELEVCEDGNVYVCNDLVFDEQSAYDEYKEGKVELSIGLEAVWVLSDNANYDFEVIDFTHVNHLALVPRGRAGGLAKILDSNAVVDRLNGGKQMKGFLKLFGIGKQKDSELSLSEALFTGVGQIKDGMKEEEVTAVVNTVMNHVAPLGESDAKKVLVGIISDSFADPAAVLGADEATKQKLAESVNGLFAKCKAEDEAKAEAVIADACGKKTDEAEQKDEKDPEDKKDEGKKDDCPCKDAEKAPQTDAASIDIEAAIAKALDAKFEGLDEKINAAVNKALGIDESKKPAVSGQKDAAPENADYDTSDLIQNAW